MWLWTPKLLVIFKWKASSFKRRNAMYVLTYICNDLWWTHIKTCSKQWIIKKVKEDGNPVLTKFTKKNHFWKMHYYQSGSTLSKMCYIHMHVHKKLVSIVNNYYLVFTHKISCLPTISSKFKQQERSYWTDWFVCGRKFRQSHHE